MPVEEDISPLVQREDTWLSTRAKVVYGNWRMHTENPPSKLVCYDSINFAWREYFNTLAWGEAVAPAAAEPEKELAASRES